MLANPRAGSFAPGRHRGSQDALKHRVLLLCGGTGPSPAVRGDTRGPGTACFVRPFGAGVLWQRWGMALAPPSGLRQAFTATPGLPRAAGAAPAPPPSPLAGARRGAPSLLRPQQVQGAARERPPGPRRGGTAATGAAGRAEAAPLEAGSRKPSRRAALARGERGGERPRSPQPRGLAQPRPGTGTARRTHGLPPRPASRRGRRAGGAGRRGACAAEL